jgi:C4-dicarboxylate-binding protein DctP
MSCSLRDVGFSLALVLSSLVSLARAEPIILRFSHVVAEDTPKGLAALRFEKLAEAYTHGAVDVQVFPNSTLYKDRDELEALQLGTVQMLAPSLAKFGPLGLSQFEMFDLPFLFDDIAAVHRLTDGPIGRELLELLQARGLTGLGYWDNGFKIMSANRPLHLPADFQGLSMRIQSSHVISAEMDALGAIPRVMALSEVREALEAGWVDGTENTPSNMLTQDIYKLQPYATVSNHGYLGYAVIVNSAFWESLPPDIRADLTRAMKDTTEYADKIAERVNEDALTRIAGSGTTELHELTDEERAAWMSALLPVREQVRDWIGGDLLDRSLAALSANSN